MKELSGSFTFKVLINGSEVEMLNQVTKYHSYTTTLSVYKRSLTNIL